MHKFDSICDKVYFICEGITYLDIIIKKITETMPCCDFDSKDSDKIITQFYMAFFLSLTNNDYESVQKQISFFNIIFNKNHANIADIHIMPLLNQKDKYYNIATDLNTYQSFLKLDNANNEFVNMYTFLSIHDWIYDIMKYNDAKVDGKLYANHMQNIKNDLILHHKNYKMLPIFIDNQNSTNEMQSIKAPIKK